MDVFCKRFAFYRFSVGFSIGVSIFVIVESGYEFSTAWGCKGCKIFVVLLPTGGVNFFPVNTFQGKVF